MSGAPRRWAAPALVVLALVGGCRSWLAGDRAGGDADADELPTAEEFVAHAEAYLAALRDGELDAAWDLVCQEGFGASDRATFDDHHATAPRPVGWELAYAERGAGSGRSSMPGGGGGTPSGAEGRVELDDGTTGEVRLWYERDGLCRISGDDAVVEAVHPAPDGG